MVRDVYEKNLLELDGWNFKWFIYSLCATV